ncbi:MAG: PQQ-dependent sugar dehydrogenase [Verrucomicrobiales bacterium]
MTASQAEEKVVESELVKFRVETVIENLQNPWSVRQIDPDTLIVAERPGVLSLVRSGEKTVVTGVPDVFARGQGGLLEVALDPDFAENQTIYLAYSEPQENEGHTVIMRAKLNQAELVEKEVIFRPPPEEYTRGGVHFGCRIVFDADGYLYFAIGDRGRMENAQSLENVAGKVHRIGRDGSIPSDNPFVDVEGAAPSIWSYGNRNAQGLDFHPVTGDLWETEHGPRGGDELNIIRPGLNYGWPVVSYGINYNGTIITEQTEAPGMEPPVIHWTPSIAVCGMSFYTGSAFPEWKNHLFVTALAHQKLVRVVIEENKVVHQEILLERTGRIRDVYSAPDGFLYVVYDDPGRVVRLVPAAE